MINYNTYPPTYSPTELLNATQVKFQGHKRNASIGMALETMNSLAQTDECFKGEADGIDALCYHLDKFTCEKSIQTLQKIIERFNVY